MQHCKVVPDSGIKEIFACGIRIPGLRNQNSDLGIRNPTNNWNPKSKFHWQGPRIEYAIQNPIKTVLDYLPADSRQYLWLIRALIGLLSIVLAIVTQSPNSMCLFPAFNFTIQLSLPNERDKDTKYFSMFLLIERMLYL